jgi:hypothetical protein
MQSPCNQAEKSCERRPHPEQKGKEGFMAGGRHLQATAQALAERLAETWVKI